MMSFGLRLGAGSDPFCNLKPDLNLLLLCHLQPGEPMLLRNARPLQHFTRPPPRYTDASLIKRLEELGIGRPSTYATILATLQVFHFFFSSVLPGRRQAEECVNACLFTLAMPFFYDICPFASLFY